MWQKRMEYLWNDGESWAKILQSDASDINTVDKNSPSGSLHNAKQG